jgi:hypothetical protein
MTLFKQSYSPSVNKLVAAVVAGIGRLAGDATGDIVLASAETSAVVTRAARLFAQALQEDSNYEMDWLWYAANMASDSQRRFCLERALQLNPDSEMARRALAKLGSQPLG